MLGLISGLHLWIALLRLWKKITEFVVFSCFENGLNALLCLNERKRKGNLIIKKTSMQRLSCICTRFDQRFSLDGGWYDIYLYKHLLEVSYLSSFYLTSVNPCSAYGRYEIVAVKFNELCMVKVFKGFRRMSIDPCRNRIFLLIYGISYNF